MELDLDSLNLEFLVPLGSVIHVGASLLQEAPKYMNSGYKPVFWFEAVPDLVLATQEIAKEFPENYVFQKLLWSEPDIEKTFYLSSNKLQSSSVFPMKDHHLIYPGIFQVREVTLSTSILDDCIEIQHLEYNSLLVIDVQGSELEVLMGSRKTLAKTWAVFIEVSTIEMYLGQSTFSEVNEYLVSQGFRLIKHDLDSQKFMGDALYLNLKKIKVDLPAEPKLPEAKRLYLWKPKTVVRRLLLKFGISANKITVKTFFRFLNRAN